MPDPRRGPEVLGREVARLHDGALAAGTHRLQLDAAALTPGFYLVRVSADGSVQMQRFVVAR